MWAALVVVLHAMAAVDGRRVVTDAERGYRYCGVGCKYPPEVRTVFLHVPKTGGASVRQALANCSARVAVEYGNHVLGAARILASGRRAALALRDPADRVVSEWDWSKERRGHDYLASERRGVHGLASGLSRRNWTLDDAPALLGHAAKSLKPMHPFLADVNRSDERLSVLCTERLDADLAAFARARGCPAPRAARLHRTSASATSERRMSDDLRAALRHAMPEDDALHARFCRRRR